MSGAILDAATPEDPGSAASAISTGSASTTPAASSLVNGTG